MLNLITRMMLASAGISHHRVSVCLHVCLYVTRRYCVTTAKRRITQHNKNCRVDC